ncbi:MAG: lysophospholipid acyltransferase family protein [Candidatus Binatia bacterium]
MFDALKLALIAAVTVPAALVIILLGFVDPHGKKVYGLARLWTWMILKIGRISLRVEGLKHIDPQSQYVFMVNHQSNIDIPVLVQSLVGFQLRWLAKKELLRVPLFGWAVWASKHIVIDRAGGLRALKSLQKAKERLQEGISIVVFPEGSRSRTGNLLPFKKGGFLLATQTNTPVVPVTINGSGASLPAGAWRPVPATVEVWIGEPLPVEGYRPGNLRLLSARARQAIELNLRQPSRPGTDKSKPIGQTIAGEARRQRRSV